jgi:hypothetical protein
MENFACELRTMADTRQRTTWGSRLRFLARAVGLLGLVAAACGASLLWAEFRSAGAYAPERLRAAAEGASGEYARTAAWLSVGGAAAVAVALAVELLGLLAGVGRRTAAGTVATLGGAAAVALLVVVNAYSFTHYARFDRTRDERFTLPPALAAELGKLRASAPTTIVVLQKHRMFGTLSDERDPYTKAAEEKVTEKVKDLVDQFREFGPQFHVAVLDTEAFGYRDRLEELTKGAPELKAAIGAAPENSIFFAANRRVQRLSFNEFMRLDKTASREAGGGRANLVLVPQGIDRFARRVLAVQERRPKAAVCVVHEWLTTVTTEGRDEFSLAGLKKSLNDQGFDVVDVVLKKNWEDRDKELEPAAYTLEESRLERLEAEEDSAASEERAARNDVRILAEAGKEAEKVPGRPLRERVEFYNDLARGAQLREWTELLAAFRKWAARGPQVTEENAGELQALVLAGLEAQGNRAGERVREAEAARREAKARVDALLADERAAQDRRVVDVKAKLARLLADADLLVVPRYTVVNATMGRGVPASIHSLDRRQAEVAKEFMKAGKPVLACMGPISSPSGPQLEAIDDFEKLLARRGIELGRETILYDAERKAFSGALSGVTLFSGGSTKPPPLILADAPQPGPKPGTTLAANPIAAAMKLTGRAAERSLAMELRAPRPVYLAPGWQEKQPFVGEFLLTPPGAWNEEKPFVTADPRTGRVTYVPRYDPTPADDPKRNTRQEERRRSFPIAVAVEGKIPAAWVNEDYDRQEAAAALLTPIDGLFATGLTVAADGLDRPVQRTVVFGSGHLFSGKELSPPQEKLLVHTVNWLTNRADRLPAPASDKTPEWQYPRVAMTERDLWLWRLGTLVGLPLAAAGLGLFAMMVRRTR